MHTHTHVCMHVYAHIHLHHDMKIIKIKASDLFEKTTTITCIHIRVILLQVNEGSEERFVYYIAFKLFESAFMHLHYLNQSN